jgi:hypothetical protein
MATSVQVLEMLLPKGGWILVGDDYEGIEFLECNPITKKEFQDGFDAYDVWKTKVDAEKATAKAALLKRLGITADEAALLLA